jgi:hypothetical protein
MKTKTKLAVSMGLKQLTTITQFFLFYLAPAKAKIATDWIAGLNSWKVILFEIALKIKANSVQLTK